MKPTELKYLAAIIAAGMIGAHGSPDPVIARKSIDLAKTIDTMVDEDVEHARREHDREMAASATATASEGAG